MTLATQLSNIAKAQGEERNIQAKEFERRIKGHSEEKLLRGCLEEAKRGREFLDFGRGLFIPQILQEEGFYLRVAGPGYHLYFG